MSFEELSNKKSLAQECEDEDCQSTTFSVRIIVDKKKDKVISINFICTDCDTTLRYTVDDFLISEQVAMEMINQSVLGEDDDSLEDLEDMGLVKITRGDIQS
jgi:hypothetical protein